MHEEVSMLTAIEALGLDRLSSLERLQLIGELWDSTADNVEQTPLTTAQREEIERRWSKFLANPDSAIPWETVQAEIMAGWQK
jgi:putative addiction module component (TIGR02574 family)